MRISSMAQPTAGGLGHAGVLHEAGLVDLGPRIVDVDAGNRSLPDVH